MSDVAASGSAMFGPASQDTDEGPQSAQGQKERAQRRRVLKGVRISFQNEYCAVEGIMKNVSDTGALIELKDGYLIPDTITIFDELAGYKIDAAVVRRHVNRIGVMFVGAKQPIEKKRAQVISQIDLRESAMISDEEPDEETETSEDPGQHSAPRRKPVFGKLGSR